MADWSVALPEPAVEGATTHVADHNTLIGALEEARANIDQNEDSAPAAHKHPAGDINSGTLETARIPALPISKVTGLQDALDKKQASGSYATTAQVEAKADASALSELAARVAALEAPE